VFSPQKTRQKTRLWVSPKKSLNAYPQSERAPQRRHQPGLSPLQRTAQHSLLIPRSARRTKTGSRNNSIGCRIQGSGYTQPATLTDVPCLAAIPRQAHLSSGPVARLFRQHPGAWLSPPFNGVFGTAQKFGQCEPRFLSVDCIADSPKTASDNVRHQAWSTNRYGGSNARNLWNCWPVDCFRPARIASR